MNQEQRDCLKLVYTGTHFPGATIAVIRAGFRTFCSTIHASATSIICKPSFPPISSPRRRRTAAAYKLIFAVSKPASAAQSRWDAFSRSPLPRPPLLEGAAPGGRSTPYARGE